MQLPDEFKTSMQVRLGNDFESFKQALQMPGPTSIRINSRKFFNLTEANVPWAVTGRYLDQRPSFTFDPHFHAGNYYVQEASSMFLEQAVRQHVDLNASLNVLDLCAAPGGKSTHLLNLINDESLLVSNEVIRSRASILDENLQKWGYPNIVITNNDPEHFGRLEEFFDVVVVDAPCSGEGLFRKDPEAVREWSPANVELCSARQKRILSDVWPSLKTGGILIYCTCTYNERENEENLKWLKAQQNIEFLRVKIEDAWHIEESVSGAVIGYRFYPHRMKGEGFFISVMRKLGAQESRGRSSKKKLSLTSRKNIQTISRWVSGSEKFTFFDHDGITHFFPSKKTQELEFLIQHLKIVTVGTTVCEFKHDKAIPAHSMAMSIFLDKDAFFRIPVSYENAISFLRREVFPVQITDKGFSIIEFEGSVLGFINNLGNRFNNLFPVEWRIRMQSLPRV